MELQAILVKDLVEYQSKSAGVTDEFGPVELKASPKEQVVEIQGNPEAKAKPRKEEVVEDLDESSDLPF